MSKAEDWRKASPQGLWLHGVEFITVGHDALDSFRKREAEGRGPGRDHVPPSRIATFSIHYNLLHGAELGLKAFILHVEAVPMSRLSSKEFGHRLDRLLETALDLDLCGCCPALTDTHISTIRHSNEPYASKQFEYRMIGGARLMPVDAVVDAADTLTAGLGVFLLPAGRLHRVAHGLAWLNAALARRAATH